MEDSSKIAGVSFYTQVKSLTWKNYILKKRNMGMIYVDLGLQVVMLLGYLLNFGVFTSKNSAMDKYFTGTDFYTFIFYLTVVVGNYISLCIFVNFQLPREKEINVAS